MRFLTKILSVLCLASPAIAHLHKVEIPPSSVIDGDSIRQVQIPLGLDISVTKNLRLWGIDAPEMGEEAGPRSKEALREMVGFCGDLKVDLHGTDNFGRILVTLYCGSTDINARLLAKGYAKPYRRDN